MITARSLIFYIRAEDQASRIVKRAGANIANALAGVSRTNTLQIQADRTHLSNLKQIEQAELRLQRTQIARANAIVTATKRAQTANKALEASQFVSPASALSYAQKNQQALLEGAVSASTASAVAAVQGHEAALENVSAVTKQMELLDEELIVLRKSADLTKDKFNKLQEAEDVGKLERYTAGFQNLARAIRFAGAVAAVSLAFTAHQASTFETQAGLAATQARKPGTPASSSIPIQRSVEQQVLKQMQKFPSTAAEMNDAFYQIFSGTNVQGVKQAAQYLTIFNKAAVAGQAPLDQMEQAGITIKNVFGVGMGGEFKNMTQAMNVFFSAVRYGRMTAAQFASSLGYITPIAKDVHLSFKNIAEDMAFFTRQTGGNLTRQDAQGLARLIQLLGRQKTAEALAAKGINVFDPVTHNMRPVLEIIKQINDQLHLTPQETVNFFKQFGGNQGTIQAIRIFSQGVQNAKAYDQVVKNVRADNDEFSKSFLEMSRQPDVAFKVFLNQIKALSLVIGEQAIPAFVTIGKSVSDVLKWFNNLSDGTKHIIGYFGVFASIGAVVGGSFLIMASSVLRFYLAVKQIRLERLASELGSVTPVGTIVIAVLTALLVLIGKYPHQAGNAAHGARALAQSLGGLETIFKSVVLGFIAFNATKVIKGFAQVGIEAEAAGAEVGILQKALIQMSELSPYIITVAVLYEPIKKLSKEFEKRTGKKLDFPVIGSVFEAGGELGHKAGKALDKFLASIYPTYKQKITQMHKKMQKDIPSEIASINPFNLYHDIETSRLATPLQKATATTLYLQKQFDKLRQLGGQIFLPMIAGEKELSKAAKSGIIQNQNQEWQKLFQNVIRLDKVISDGKVHSLKDYKDLRDAEDALQKASTGNQYQAAMDMLSALESTWNSAEKSATKHAKNLAKIMKQNVENAKNELGNLLQGVQSMYDNILQQNQSLYGGLFQGPVVNGARVQDNLQFGGFVTGQDLLKDQKGQLYQFNRFNRQIDELSRRGAPKKFIDQIRGLGQEAEPDIKALLTLTPKQMHDYVTTWQKGQAAIKSSTMSQLNSQLKTYQSYGRAIARAILKGVQSEDQNLQSELEKVVLKLFPGLAKQAHGVIYNKHVPKVPKEPKLHSTRTRGLSSAYPSHVHNEHHTVNNYNITAPASEHQNIKTQMEHANFIIRNKYKGNS